MSSLSEVVYGWLSADSALRSLLGGSDDDPRIYPSHPRQDAAFPCLSYRLGPGRDVHELGGPQTTAINVDVWSRQDSPRQAETIAQAVKAALKDKQRFEPGLTVWKVERCELDSGPLYESEYGTYHVALRFRVQLIL